MLKHPIALLHNRLKEAIRLWMTGTWLRSTGKEELDGDESKVGYNEVIWVGYTMILEDGQILQYPNLSHDAELDRLLHTHGGEEDDWIGGGWDIVFSPSQDILLQLKELGCGQWTSVGPMWIEETKKAICRKLDIFIFIVFQGDVDTSNVVEFKVCSPLQLTSVEQLKCDIQSIRIQLKPTTTVNRLRPNHQFTQLPLVNGTHSLHFLLVMSVWYPSKIRRALKIGNHCVRLKGLFL